jgi:hypothetical protein
LIPSGVPQPVDCQYHATTVKSTVRGIWGEPALAPAEPWSRLFGVRGDVPPTHSCHAPGISPISPDGSMRCSFVTGMSNLSVEGAAPGCSCTRRKAISCWSGTDDSPSSRAAAVAARQPAYTWTISICSGAAVAQILVAPTSTATVIFAGGLAAESLFGLTRPCEN